MTSSALQFVAPGKVQVTEVDIPAPGPGEILVRNIATAVSPGTELRCFVGTQPDAEPFPFIPGYSAVGRVIGGEGFAPGTLVYHGGTKRASATIMWGGHTEYAVMPVSAAYEIPAGVDPVAGGLAHLAAIALRGVRMAQPSVYDRVVVIGLGPIGQLSTRLFRASGAKVLALDLAEERVELAMRCGALGLVPACGANDAVRNVWPDGADIVVDATGSNKATDESVAALRDRPWGDVPVPGAKLVVQGSYPKEIAIPYQQIFLKEATVFFPRDCQPGDVRHVLSMMADGRLSCRELVTRLARPEEATAVYHALQNPGSGLVTAAFQWDEVP